MRSRGSNQRHSTRYGPGRKLCYYTHTRWWPTSPPEARGHLHEGCGPDGTLQIEKALSPHKDVSSHLVDRSSGGGVTAWLIPDGGSEAGMQRASLKGSETCRVGSKGSEPCERSEALGFFFQLAGEVSRRGLRALCWLRDALDH